MQIAITLVRRVCATMLATGSEPHSGHTPGTSSALIASALANAAVSATQCTCNAADNRRGGGIDRVVLYREQRICLRVEMFVRHRDDTFADAHDASEHRRAGCDRVGQHAQHCAATAHRAAKRLPESAACRIRRRARSALEAGRTGWKADNACCCASATTARNCGNHRSYCRMRAAQARRASREHARAIGQAHARNRARRQSFDFTALQDALGHAGEDSG